MSTGRSVLSREVMALVHHVELNRAGWWDKVVQRLTLAAVWLADHAPSVLEIKRARDIEPRTNEGEREGGVS